MRVLIDSRKIFDGGIGVYTRNLIQALSKYSELQLNLLVLESDQPRVQELFSSKFPLITTTAKPLSLQETFCLGKQIKQATKAKDFDLYHNPYFTLAKNLPAKAKIITIHDLIQITHPENFYYPMVAKFLLKRNIKQANRVITVSQESKRLIQEKLNAEANKVSYIPNAIDPNFLPEHLGCHLASNSQAVTNNGYFISIFSNLKPHKGLESLISIFSEYVKNKPASKLILVGSSLIDYLNDNQVAKELIEKKQLELTGFISDEELKQLISNCKALLVPSVVEGFCLPALQAHALGKPVVARPVPATMELLTDKDFIANDMSDSAFLTAINQVTAMENHAFDLKKFSLEELAENTLAVYNSCLQ